MNKIITILYGFPRENAIDITENVIDKMYNKKYNYILIDKDFKNSQIIEDEVENGSIYFIDNYYSKISNKLLIPRINLDIKKDIFLQIEKKRLPINIYIKKINNRICKYYREKDNLITQLKSISSITIYDLLPFDYDYPCYNIGDILNIPALFLKWNYIYTPKLWCKFSALQYPGSIVNNYYKIRKNDEIIPNQKTLLNAIKLYITENNEKIDKKIIYTISQNTTVCIHLRLGDRLHNFSQQKIINRIINFSNKYKQVIILAGIHGDERFLPVEKSINHTYQLLKKISKNNFKHNIFLLVTNPDNTIVYGYLCKNFVKDFGGFTKIIEWVRELK